MNNYENGGGGMGGGGGWGGDPTTRVQAGTKPLREGGGPQYIPTIITLILST